MARIVLEPQDRSLLDRLRAEFPAAFEDAVKDVRVFLDEDTVSKLRTLLEGSLIYDVEIHLATRAVERFAQELGCDVGSILDFRYWVSDADIHLRTGGDDYQQLGDMADAFVPDEAIFTEEREEVMNLVDAGASLDEALRQVMLVEKPDPDGLIWPVMSKMDAWLGEHFKP